ncbi:MAG: response regulator, partial [Syntrophothermus sp.]
IGIDRSKLNLIFEPFRQVHEGTGRNFEGVGLGLTIAKKYAELLKGDLTVESTPGSGSVFILRLPILSKTEMPVQVTGFNSCPESSSSAVNGSLPDILYVEDDANNRLIMSLLTRGTCNLDLAADGEGALKMISTKKYDAIMMDINLGSGIDGIQAAQMIRLTPGYKNTPVAAVTAYAAESDRKNFLKQGCTHFLPKPFSKKEITELIQQLSDYNRTLLSCK